MHCTETPSFEGTGPRGKVATTQVTRCRAGVETNRLEWLSTSAWTAERWRLSVVFQNLDHVPVGVAHEGGRHGPVLEPFRLGDRFRVRIDAALVEALAIVGFQVQLSKAVPVVDWSLLFVVARELYAVSVFAREDFGLLATARLSFSGVGFAHMRGVGCLFRVGKIQDGA